MSNDTPLPAYPTTPSSGASASSRPTVVPGQVKVAFWMYIVAAVVSLATVIIAIATIGATRAATESLLSSRSHVSAAAVNTVVMGGIVVGITFAIVFVAAYVLFANFMRRGANWARIVLLILTVLSLFSVTADYGAGALRGVVGVIATILMFLKPANQYFRAVKASKQIR